MSKVKAMTRKPNTFDRVYEVVRKIPLGKVATYGQIARIMNKGKVTPRIVGFALHANRDPKVPCHRVVNKDGRLAPNFALDGPKEQRRRLIAEGVKFKDQTYVDLDKNLWSTDYGLPKEKKQQSVDFRQYAKR